MTGPSITAKALSVAAACLLHGAAIWALAGRADVEAEGAAGAAEVSIGTSFAEMAAGTLSADPPPEEIEPVETATAEARPVIRETPPEKLVETVAPDKPDRTPAMQADTGLQSPQPVPTETARVEPAAAARRTEAAEVIAAADASSPAISRSLRPKGRSAAFEAAHKPAADPKPQRAARQEPPGNADRNARTGAATGREQIKDKAATAGRGRSQEAGNAAASNYPGMVLRKISGVPRPRVGARGTAVVAFTIAPGGGLSAISVARSSGSARLDRAALTVIRRAAPFPAPPPGARRSFSIRIKGG